jgi:hypothetical protein
MMDTPEAIAERVRHLEMKRQPFTPYKSKTNDYDRVDRRLSALESAKFVPLTSPLTSESWDGDSFSTTAKTLIDLSAVFSVPAGVSAVLVRAWARDSGSAAGIAALALSPNDTAGTTAIGCDLSSLANDAIMSQAGICPCNTDGDIYYQVVATGEGTLDAWIQIWGYWL